MTTVKLNPAARRDWQAKLRYYRKERGAATTHKLIDALEAAVTDLARNPGIGSPRIGQILGLPGLRAWPLRGFPESLWYFVHSEADAVLVVHVAGHQQDIGGFDFDKA